MTLWWFEVEEDRNEKCVFLIIDDVDRGKVDEIEDEGDSLSENWTELDQSRGNGTVNWFEPILLFLWVKTYDAHEEWISLSFLDFDHEANNFANIFKACTDGETFLEKLDCYFKEDGLPDTLANEKPPKRRRRKAGEISGRQLALKK